MTKNTNNKSFNKVNIKKIDGSKIEIEASIDYEIWSKYRNQAIKNINESITMDGFRKGMIPENILISKVGEGSINEEMAELAISKAYADIIIENELDIIGKPQVQLNKLAKENPLEFKIISAVIPEIQLPDYKAIAKKEVNKAKDTKITVEEKDIEDAILKIRKSKAYHKDHSCDGGADCDHKHEEITENPDSTKDSKEKKEDKKETKELLPEFNDEFVKSLGDFKDVNDFKEKIKVMIQQNKEDEAREKLRIKIADAISEETKTEIPEIIIDSELDRTQAQFTNDIEKMGVKMEDYLKHANKKIEEIRAEWAPHAEKKAKLQLIINAIAKKENIKPDQKEIEAEVEYITQHYKDADRERATLYADTVLTNEKVFRMLEESK